MKSEIRERMEAARAAALPGDLEPADVALAEPPAPPPFDPVAAERQEQELANLRLEKLERELRVESLLAEKGKRDEEKENKRRLSLANIERLKEERKIKERAQLMCDHRKMNGRPNIGGQRLSNSKLSLVCQNCFKTFDEDTIPPHLGINMDNIGG